MTNILVKKINEETRKVEYQLITKKTKEEVINMIEKFERRGK